MINFFKKGQEFNKIAKGFNGIYPMINELEVKIDSSINESSLQQDLFVLAYLCRKEILDRMESNNWDMNTSIIVPFMSKGRITLTYAFNKTVLRLHKIAEDLEVYEIVIGILDRDDNFYEIENSIPIHIKNIL